jgi:hypothetical protein
MWRTREFSRTSQPARSQYIGDFSTCVEVFPQHRWCVVWRRPCGTHPLSEGNDGLRVALLAPGPISNQASNGEAYRGLLAIRDTLGAAICHIQNRTPAAFDESLRECGRQSYDLIIGHGFEYQDAAKRMAPAGPGTIFPVTSTDVRAPNVAAIRQLLQHMDCARSSMSSGSWGSPVSRRTSTPTP